MNVCGVLLYMYSVKIQKSTYNAYMDYQQILAVINEKIHI